MAYQSYRIWDGKTSLTGNPAATPERLMSSYSKELVDQHKQMVVYTTLDQNGNPFEGSAAFFDAEVSADAIKADFDAQVAQQKAAEAVAAEAAKQPTIESRVAALEAAQLAALGV